MSLAEFRQSLMAVYNSSTKYDEAFENVHAGIVYDDESIIIDMYKGRIVNMELSDDIVDYFRHEPNGLAMYINMAIAEASDVYNSAIHDYVNQGG